MWKKIIAILMMSCVISCEVGGISALANEIELEEENIEEIILLNKELSEELETLETLSYMQFEEGFIQNESYPEGQNITFEITNIIVSDNSLMEVVFDNEAATWNLKALLPGNLEIRLELNSGEAIYEITKEVTIICNHPATIEKVQIDTLLNQARKWIGKKESNGSFKEIINIYNAHAPLPIGYKVKYTDHWCATFVSALAINNNYSYLFPKECGCERMIALLEKMEMWEEDESVEPKSGWIIFYDWEDKGKGNNLGWSDHVGIVEKVEDGVITVIEGNYDAKVKRRTINVNGRYIRGYGIPVYGNEIEPATFSKNGKIFSGCSLCGENETEKIPAASNVSLSETSYTYDKKVKTPKVIITDKAGNAIEDKHYTLTYSNGRKYPGKHNVRVEFNGMYYSGVKNLSFIVYPKAPETVTAKLSGGYDDIKVSWNESIGADGYVVYFKKSTTKDFVKMCTTTKLSCTKKNLTDGVKYLFKVVPYLEADGKKVESIHSKTANTYTLKAVDKPIVKKYSSTRVKLNWTDITNESGYQISKSTSKLKTNVIATVSKTNATLKVTKGKNYYYKIRAYKTVNGKRIYGPWSPVRPWKLK